jgi:putative tricarboxylic transport membrane protein
LLPEFLFLQKTFLINDLVWMGLAFLVCLGGLKLGFGSFSQPHAGFMPFLAGLALGLLALGDLSSGLITRWKSDKPDREIWADIHWGKLLLTMGVLFVFSLFFTALGFLISTLLLLFYLFRVMEPKTWKFVLFASLLTTFLFYLGFKVGLDSQLPRGFLGY